MFNVYWLLFLSSFGSGSLRAAERVRPCCGAFAHRLPSLSVECAEPLRARCPHAPWCLPNFDNAKVQKIEMQNNTYPQLFSSLF